MKQELIKILRCPISKQKLRLESSNNSSNEIKNARLISNDKQFKYQVTNFIPRFLFGSNYADNFGLQWNHFSKTQLDSYSGHPISEKRFWNATNWNPEKLKNRWVLDVGCGSGRFTEVALKAGAKVVALDYSSAVDACYANLNHYPNLHVIQGDIYALPFAKESFSYVFSLGVLQHTPDVAKAFASLPPMLEMGGKLCVDYYEKSFKSRLLPKYWLRPITKRLPQSKLFSALEYLVPMMLLLSRRFGSVPMIGRVLQRLVPVANYDGILPLNEQQLIEWALLDTFDWLAPAYDNPQTAATVLKWLEQAGLQSIEVLKAGHLVGRGQKPDRRDTKIER